MIAVVTHRVSGSVRTCSSLSQTWPPNSSDLNPVDYAIWGAFQQMVYHRQSFVSVDELTRHDCRGMAETTAIVHRHQHEDLPESYHLLVLPSTLYAVVFSLQTRLEYVAAGHP